MNSKDDFSVELTILFNAIAGRGTYDPRFYILIHDYVALVKKACEVSQPLYDLFVGKQAIFDHQVAEIEKEPEYYDEAQRNDSLADAHFRNFTPQYDQLVNVHDEIEKSEKASVKLAMENK